MKPSSIIAMVAALAGFAMGWALKPSGDSTAGETTATTPPPRQRPGTSELVAPSSRKGGPTEAVTIEEVESQVVDTASIRRAQAFSHVTGKREKARLARFAEALGLDLDQLESVAALLAKHKGATTATPDGLLVDAADGDLEFEDALLALLDDDQKERLNAFKTRVAENRIEASAMKDLTKVMSTIDLSSDQRERLLENYREKSRIEHSEEPDTWSLLTDNGIGGGSTNNAHNRYRDIFSDPSVTSDPQKLAEAISNEETKQAEEELGLISGELTEQQMAEMRASISNANATIFGKSIRNPKFSGN
ncbi:hypothetical protein [Haloferula sp.]|uniref:hypothetical protein n=1 Tax=Haloferula sp. TaxID=2497595 RepID=UPI00329DC357